MCDQLLLPFTLELGKTMGGSLLSELVDHIRLLEDSFTNSTMQVEKLPAEEKARTAG